MRMSTDNRDTYVSGVVTGREYRNGITPLQRFGRASGSVMARAQTTYTDQSYRTKYEDGFHAPYGMENREVAQEFLATNWLYAS